MNKKLLTIFLFINSVVLYNSVFHDPRIGYDSYSHFEYIQTLSQFKLPAPSDTLLFYNPPLYYIAPAIFQFLLRLAGITTLGFAAKFSQLTNLFYSLGTTLFIIKICGLYNPKNYRYSLFSLFFMSLFTVYYKTFAFIRPEPLLTFLVTIAIYKILQMFSRKRTNLRESIFLSLILGAILLTKQTGFVFLLAFIIFALIKAGKNLAIYRMLVVSVFLAVLFSGPFYFHLYKNWGSILLFNRAKAAKFSFSNQPKEFYTGLGNGKLFTNPIRNSFPNQLLPILYSEIWGDYWNYFVVWGIDKTTGMYLSGHHLDLESNIETNKKTITSLLARVNLLSLIPTIVVIISILYSKGETVSFLKLVIFLTIAGFIWFTVSYPNPGKGDTIKASYIVHIIPPVSIVSSIFLNDLRKINKPIFYIFLIALSLVFIHNSPVFISRYFFALLGKRL